MSSAPPTQALPSSAPTRASTSSSAATKTHNGMTKRFIFSSEWYFKPEGVKLVKQRFNKELGAKNLVRSDLPHPDIDWNDEDHSFRISCAHAISDGVLEIFFIIFQEVIDEESGDGWEESDDDSSSGGEYEKPTKSNKIQHLSSLRNKFVPKTIEGSYQNDVSSSCGPIVGIDFPEKVRFYKAKAVWECQTTKPSLDEVVPDELLRKLTSLVTCEFVKDLNQGKIYIGARSEGECCRAFRKLDNIRRYWVLRCPLVKHLFYAEELEQYEVSFKHIVDVKKKYFETTLLDNLELSRARFDYFNLVGAITVRCAPFNSIKSRFTPFKMGKYIAAVDFDKKDSNLREWKGFIYAHHMAYGQDQLNNTMKHFETFYQFASQPQRPQQLEKSEQSNAQYQNVEQFEVQVEPAHNAIESIQRWNAGVGGQDLPSSADVSEVIELDHGIFNKLPKDLGWDNYQPLMEQYTSKKKHVRPQNLGLRAEVSTIVSINTPDFILPPQKALFQPVTKPTRLQAFDSAIIRPTSPRSLSSLSPTTQAPFLENIPPQKEFQSHSPFAFNHLVQDLFSDFLQGHPAETPTPALIDPIPVKPVTGLLIPFIGPEPSAAVATDENIARFNFTGFEVMKPVKNDPVSLPSSPKDLLSDEVSISFPEYPVTYPDALQPVSQVDTPIYYKTLKQKASKPPSIQKPSKSRSYATKLEASLPRARTGPLSAPVMIIDPTPAFIAIINDNFQDLIERFRAFQGEIVVQAEFGRLLMKRIPRKLIAFGDSEASLDRDEALKVVENTNGAGPFAVFTKVLTALPADISFLVEMKDRKGQPLWKQEHLDWSVLYEILCVDGRSGTLKPFIIEIDGERLVFRAKVRRDFGEINVNAIKRHWDFRISATGIEADGNVDPAYQNFAKTVEDSFFIPEGLSDPILFFEIPDGLAHFSIHGVRVRRISRFRSFDTKSILKVAEVRELQNAEAKGEYNTIHKWFGSPDPSIWLRDFGYKWQFVWHEASISCSKMDEILQQNQTLELGEEASWTPETFSAVGALPSMYLPTCEMIKQMDGIGFYNDNEMPVQPASTSSLAETANARPYYFW